MAVSWASSGRCSSRKHSSNSPTISAQVSLTAFLSWGYIVKHWKVIVQQIPYHNNLDISKRAHTPRFFLRDCMAPSCDLWLENWDQWLCKYPQLGSLDAACNGHRPALTPTSCRPATVLPFPQSYSLRCQRPDADNLYVSVQHQNISVVWVLLCSLLVRPSTFFRHEQGRRQACPRFQLGGSNSWAQMFGVTVFTGDYSLI